MPDRVRLTPGVLRRARRPRSPDDFVAAKYDADGRHLETLLLVLSTPRSGSKFLCDQLRLGADLVAHEYFHPLTCLPLLAERWGAFHRGAIDVDGYLDALISHRASPDGVLGVNVHGLQLPTFHRFSVLLQRAPEIRVVYLTRRDRLAQAISFVIANQTQVWTSGFEARREARYSARQITNALQEIARQTAVVEAFIEHNCLEVHHLAYEDVVADPKATLAPLIAGPAAWRSVEPGRPVVRRQAKGRNDTWRERYLLDSQKEPHPHASWLRQAVLNSVEPLRR